MFLVVDLVRHAILLAVHLCPLLRGQMTTVRGPIIANFAIDPSFLVLEVRRFTRRQLAALDSLRNAVLLILGALSDFAFRIRVLHRRVVLVLINLLRQLILLLVDHGTIGTGEFAAVLAAHQLLFFVQVRFFALEIRGFTGCQLSAGDAIGNSVLLIFLALVDGRGRIRR